MLEVHRLRHLEWKPSPVVALAESGDGSAVAAARESGAIEIWNVAPGSVGWHCELALPGRKDAAISSVAWCNTKTRKGSIRGRLFSAALDGFITEWDLETLQPKEIVESYGGPVWKLAFEPAAVSSGSDCRPSLESASRNLARHRECRSRFSDCSDSDVCGESDSDEEGNDNDTEKRLAVACDDGSVRLLTVSESKDGIAYKSSFPRVKGRILSIAWHSDGSRLYAGGSDGCIRCWDAVKMHEVYRITAGIGGLGSLRNLCVWSLLVLRDGTIVSGDSSGSTQFWDGISGALLKSHTAHKADVLSLAAAPSHQTVFSAGADGQVVLYQLVEESKRLADQDLPSGVDVPLGLGSKWEFVGAKRTHLHDVRALAVACPCISEEEMPNNDLMKKSPRKKLRKEQSYAKWEKRGIPMLISAGNDTKLFAYPANAFLHFYPHDISPAPERTFVQLANKCYSSGAVLVMAQHANLIDIWKVFVENSIPWLENRGSSISNHCSSRKRKLENLKGPINHCQMGNLCGTLKNKRCSHVTPEENGNSSLRSNLGRDIQKQISKVKGEPPSLLARIKSKGAEHISCSAISGNGRFVAFSDQTKPRLYEFQQRGDEFGLKSWGIKKSKLPDKLSAAHSMIFSEPLMHLILACHNHEVHVIDVESAQKLHTFHIKHSVSHFGGKASPITLLSSSFDGQWLAACTSSGDITVLNLETCRHHWSVPVFDGSPPTAIVFHPGNLSVMIVSTAGNHIHMLDVEAKAFTEWSKLSQAHIPSEILEFPGGITGLSIPQFSKSMGIIAYSPKAMCYIDLRRPFRPQQDPKVLKKHKSLASGGSTHALQQRFTNGDQLDNKSNSSEENFIITTFEEPVLFVGHLSERSLLVVERPWSEVLLSLPAPVFRHMYGT